MRFSLICYQLCCISSFGPQNWHFFGLGLPHCKILNKQSFIGPHFIIFWTRLISTRKNKCTFSSLGGISFAANSQIQARFSAPRRGFPSFRLVPRLTWADKSAQQAHPKHDFAHKIVHHPAQNLWFWACHANLPYFQRKICSKPTARLPTGPPGAPTSGEPAAHFTKASTRALPTGEVPPEDHKQKRKT